jgi:signal transduction histidine kinase
MRRVWPDWVVVAVCTVVQLLSLQPGTGGGGSSWAGLAFGAGLLGGLVLVWRREAPLWVLGGATVAYVAQAAAVGPIVPAAVAAACYAAARYAPMVHGVVAGLLAVAVVVGTVLVKGPADLAGSYAVLLVLAVLAGVLVAARQVRVEAMRRSAVLEERLRIARDLHDVVGHGLGAITVQAGTGRMALAAGADDEVRRALLSIEQAGRGVLREVRWLVGVLRDRPDEVNLGDLPALADAARSAGFDVRMTVDGDLGSVPQPTGEASYRIVQEALTNAFRHSGSESVWVHVDVGDVLTVMVLDEGTAGQAAEGHGIRGMRERAAAVGGELCVGPPADGPGWEVRATLPMRGSRR